MKQHTIRPSLDLESESVPSRPAHLNAPISIAAFSEAGRPLRGRLGGGGVERAFHGGGAAGRPRRLESSSEALGGAARRGAARLLLSPPPPHLNIKIS